MKGDKRWLQAIRRIVERAERMEKPEPKEPAVGEAAKLLVGGKGLATTLDGSRLPKRYEEDVEEDEGMEWYYDEE